MTPNSALALAILVSSLVAVPIAAAAIVKRGGPASQWLKQHIRWLWGFVALCWLASSIAQYFADSPMRWLNLTVSVVGLSSAVLAAFFMPRSEEREGS